MVRTPKDVMSYLQLLMDVSDLLVILKKVGINVWETASGQVFVSGDILH